MCIHILIHKFFNWWILTDVSLSDPENASFTKEISFVISGCSILVVLWQIKLNLINIHFNLYRFLYSIDHQSLKEEESQKQTSMSLKLLAKVLIIGQFLVKFLIICYNDFVTVYRHSSVPRSKLSQGCPNQK